MKSTTSPPVHRAGPIAEERARRLIRAARPDIDRLLPEAMRGGAAVALFVFDPVAGAALVEGCSDAMEQAQHQELVQIAAGKPLTSLLPAQTIVGLLQNFEEESEAVAFIIRRLTADRDPSFVPVVLQAGSIFGMVEMGQTPMASFLIVDGKDVREAVVDGERTFVTNLAGTLKYLLDVDLADVGTDAARERIRRFQEKSRGLIAAESIRATPRDVGEVLIAGFGGEVMRKAWATRLVDGMVEQLDRVLARSTS